MANFDWHADRTDLSVLALLGRAPENEGIDLKAVRLYRLDRTRNQMVKYGLGAAIISDPVNILYVAGTSHLFTKQRSLWANSVMQSHQVSRRTNSGQSCTNL